jgi:hypothetical protein
MRRYVGGQLHIRVVVNRIEDLNHSQSTREPDFTSIEAMSSAKTPDIVSEYE